MTDPNAQHLLDLDWLSSDERCRRILYRLMIDAVASTSATVAALFFFIVKS